MQALTKDGLAPAPKATPDSSQTNPIERPRTISEYHPPTQEEHLQAATGGETQASPAVDSEVS